MSREKSGKIDPKIYEDEEMIDKFDGIRLNFLKDSRFSNDPSVTNENLSLLTGNIQNFMEDNLGKNSKKPCPLVRLPAKIFRDFNPKGSLFRILKTCYKFKQERSWKVFNFKSKTGRPEIIQMLKNIEKVLTEKGVLSRPRFFFNSTVSDSMVEKLSTVAERYGASVLSTPDNATHIVDYDKEVDSGFGTEAEADYLKTLVVRPDKGKAFVHWWYFPDSHDEWIALEDVEGQAPEEEIEEPEVWRVNCRFIRDVAKFNEWGNELDYEIEDPPAIDASRASTKLNVNDLELQSEGSDLEDGEERRAVAPRMSSRKRSATDFSWGDASINDPKRTRREAQSLDSHKLKQPQILMPSKNPSRQKDFTCVDIQTNERIEFEDEEQHFEEESSEEFGSQTSSFAKKIGSLKIKIKPQSDRSTDQHSDAGDDSQPVDQTPEIHTKRISIEYKPTELPTAWFNDQAISEFEKRMLPEFFTGHCLSKTPETYMSWRNFMIEASKNAPKVRLTSTLCRHRLAGDACAIVRLHTFLEKFGLINGSPFLEKERPRTTYPIPSLPSQATQSLSGPFDRGETSQKLKEWTYEEEKNLLLAVDKHTEDWSAVANAVGGGKSEVACLLKFLSLGLEGAIENFMHIKQEHTNDSNPVGSILKSNENFSAESVYGEQNEKILTSVPHLNQLHYILNKIPQEIFFQAYDASKIATSEFQQQITNVVNKDNTDPLQEVETHVKIEKMLKEFERIKHHSDVAVLSCLSLQARQLAVDENMQISRICNDLLDAKMKRIELKMSQLDEVENLLELERHALQIDRADLFSQQVRFWGRG